MQKYKNKNELITEIVKLANLFINEFDTIDEADKDKLVEGIDHTPSQMITYQLGWMNLIMDWDRRELEKKEVITPTPEYKWNQLGGLYESFYIKYKDNSLLELKRLFKNNIEQIISWINDFSYEELIMQNVRKWASSTQSKWPIWKWIHINTVAPFKTFRTKIRKWKKTTNK